MAFRFAFMIPIVLIAVSNDRTYEAYIQARSDLDSVVESANTNECGNYRIEYDERILRFKVNPETDRQEARSMLLGSLIVFGLMVF